MKSTIEKSSGITLIVLIITIIILLLLSGVAIAQITQNELFTKAKVAKDRTKEAQLKEEIELAIMEIQTEEIVKGNDVTLDTLASGQLINKLENITVRLKNHEITGEYKGYIYKINNNFNVTVEAKAQGEYIDTVIQADKKIYISLETGNDLIGNGTKQKPYATLDKIAETGIIENGYSYVLILMDGTYELTTKMFELNCNKEINIIGNKEKTVLIVNSIYPNTSGGKDNYTLNFYRMIWRADTVVTNAIFPLLEMNLYNIVFDINYDAASFSYFIPLQKSFRFYNCILPKLVTGFLRCDNGIIQLTNCYGGFTSGYGTSDDMWNYQTNYITATPRVDGNYRITDNDNVWKNVGTGTNLDGTRADLGVYGGEFSWEN